MTKIIGSPNSFEIGLVRIAHTSFRLWRDIARKIIWCRINSFSSCFYCFRQRENKSPHCRHFCFLSEAPFCSDLIQIFGEHLGLTWDSFETILERNFGLETLLENSVHSSNKTVQFWWKQCAISGQRRAEISCCSGAVSVAEKRPKQ